MHKPPRSMGLAIVAVALALWPARAQAPATSSVEFVAPRRLATVVGPSVAELTVVPPAGSSVVSVAFFVDGTAAGGRTKPPWSFPWAAGDGTAGHRLTAVA